jgi:hypothetical protein
MARRARKLEVGQTWRAERIDDYDGKRHTGFKFVLLHQELYRCKETRKYRKSWLALILGRTNRPHNENRFSTWWFDDQGICHDENDAECFKFILTRKCT